MARRLEKKPLSFSTTMRNPERIADFLYSLKSFEGKILTNDLIHDIVKVVLSNKIYMTMFQKREEKLKEIFNSEGVFFSEEELERIIKNSPQNHKEAGFDKGWASRFDTWYKLPKELGFLYYKMNQPIEISESGHLLIDTVEQPFDEKTKNVSNIFTNALVKYQRDNPFRRNLISNAPFILCLQTIKVLQENYDWEKSGIYRSELSFVICWDNADAKELAAYINNFRLIYGKQPSDEVIYEACLELLESENETRFKMSQVLKEGVDDLIRKLRITNLISLRGMGRLLDINSFEKEKVDYVLETYTNYEVFDDEYKYYQYAGHIDEQLVEIVSGVSEASISDVRQKTLNAWGEMLTKEKVYEELRVLANKNGKSKDVVLKEISTPTRFEFLTSIALRQQFRDLEIKPNYSIDDEGMPTFTARGGVGDIEIHGKEDDVLVEVTLMQNKSQAVNEIPGITRHLKEFGDREEKEVYALFIAPTIHLDTSYMIEFTKDRKNEEINGYTIDDFVDKLSESNQISDLRKIELLQKMD